MFSFDDEFNFTIDPASPFSTVEYATGGVIVCNDGETTITATAMSMQSGRISIAAIVSHCDALCVASTFCADVQHTDYHEKIRLNYVETLAELNSFVATQFSADYLN